MTELDDGLSRTVSPADLEEAAAAVKQHAAYELYEGMGELDRKGEGRLHSGLNDLLARVTKMIRDTFATAPEDPNALFSGRACLSCKRPAARIPPPPLAGDDPMVFHVEPHANISELPQRPEKAEPGTEEEAVFVGGGFRVARESARARSRPPSAAAAREGGAYRKPARARPKSAAAAAGGATLNALQSAMDAATEAPGVAMSSTFRKAP